LKTKSNKLQLRLWWLGSVDHGVASQQLENQIRAGVAELHIAAAGLFCHIYCIASSSAGTNAHCMW